MAQTSAIYKTYGGKRRNISYGAQVTVDCLLDTENHNISDKTLDEIAKSDFDSPIALEGEQFRLLSGNLTKNYDPDTHKIKNITFDRCNNE